MTILKRALLGALLGSLRIALFGSLKLGLFVYAFFLPDTAFAGAMTEGSDYTEGTDYVAASDSYAIPQVGSIVNMNKQDALLPTVHGS